MTHVTVTQSQHSQRLQLYNSLFAQDTTKTCDKTGLQSTQSLNYSLHTFLHLCDKHWVLAIIDIDSFDDIEEKYGKQNGRNKLNQIGIVVKKFSENNPTKLKGFKCDDLIDDENSCQHDLFGLLMHCYRKLEISNKYVLKLIKNIQQQTNELVFVGVAKMNEWETFEEWKTRAFKSLKNAKNSTNATTETSNNNATFFSDIGVKFVKPNDGDDEKQQKQRQMELSVPLVNKKMGKETEFEAKMKEIANNEDYDWIVAIMAIDDYDAFIFSNNNNKEAASKEIDKMEQEMYYLFDIYGNGMNGKELKYFGYKLARDGEFGLILYDSKDTSKCYVPGHEILETLKEEINMKCLFSVSIGSSRLIEDDLGFSDDWYERINENLKQAKKNGANEICFGGCLNDINNKIVDCTGQDYDNMITLNSLQKINVCFVVHFYLYMLHLEFGVCVCVSKQKYGLIAAVKVKDINIVANNGKLASSNDSDVKFDYDPTQSFAVSFCTITYQQILYETIAFIGMNNDGDRQYLKYPKLYLQHNNPHCGDKKHCEQCRNHNSDNGFEFDKFVLCLTKRRQVANIIHDSAREGGFMTDSLTTTTAKLFISDDSLRKDSRGYKIHSNWFSKVYSFLKWQQEVINALHHLVCLNDASQNDRKRTADIANNDIKEDDNSATLVEYIKLQDRSVSSDSYTSIDGIGSPALHGADVAPVQSPNRWNDVSDRQETKYHDTNNIDIGMFLVKFDLLTSLHLYLGQLIEYLVLFYCCFDEQSWIAVFYSFIEAAVGTVHCTMLFGESTSCSKQVSSLCGEALSVYQNAYSVQQVTPNRDSILREMKAICLFKRLLCNAYDDDDKQDSNPFELVDKVCGKLQENSNNIKTQLLIMEMTRNDTKLNVDERKNDYLCVDQSIFDSCHYRSEVPGFIRLFVIRRIIGEYVSNKNGNNETDDKIKRLTSSFQDNIDPKIVSTAFDILSRLINNGIKQYMAMWYNEKEQTDIIEMIFNKLILNKFKHQYSQLITYNRNHDYNLNVYYQNLVFNSSDLICSIFQYLEYGYKFDGDLVSCSLVNSCWLYHSWNINAVYHVDLGALMDITVKYNENDENNILRIWQRLINVKSIEKHFPSLNKLLLSKLLLLRNVEKFYAWFDDFDTYHNAGFKALMFKYAQRVTFCKVFVPKPKTQPPLVIRFPNAQYIYIGDLYFYRLWSNRCEHLVLGYDSIVDKQWCDFVIDHCDCSNVSILHLQLYKIDPSVNKSVLKQLASKFINIQLLEIRIDEIVDKNVLLLWKMLKPQLLQNNGNVKLFVDDFEDDEYGVLNNVIQQEKLKIDKLILRKNYWKKENTTFAAKFIQNRDNDGLNHLKFISRRDKLELCKQISFSSTNILEFDDDKYMDNHLSYLNDILGLNKVIKTKLLIILNTNITVDEKETKQDNDKFSLLFRLLCKNINRLMKYRVPVDIRITFSNVNMMMFEKCNTIYASILSANILSQYKEPRCNSTICVSRREPHLFFAATNKAVDCVVLIATNVEDVQQN